jgi:hypothetical protein
MDIKTTKQIISSNVTSSIMLHANHGVGKSSCVKQVAKQLGIEFFDIRLSQCDVGDIKGLPYRDGETMKFAKPEWWPRDSNSKGILFFDELNRASKDVLQAVFEICLDRTLDGDKLPDGWKIVSAVNSHSDYDVMELDPALQDRWFHIDFSPSAKEWLDWADGKVNPAIVQFISQNQNLLDAPVGNLETGRVYPSRRSWEALSHFILELNLLDESNVGLLVQSTKGWCGEECAIMFQKFVANEFKLLKAEDVLDNFKKVKSQIEKSSEDIEVISALANAVIKEANNREAKNLQDKQKEALKQFFLMLPNDVASDFFLGLTEGKKTARLITKLNSDSEVQEKLKAVYGM